MVPFFFFLGGGLGFFFGGAVTGLGVFGAIRR